MSAARCSSFFAPCSFSLVICPLLFAPCSLSLVLCPISFVHFPLFIFHCSFSIIHDLHLPPSAFAHLAPHRTVDDGPACPRDSRAILRTRQPGALLQTHLAAPRLARTGHQLPDFPELREKPPTTRLATGSSSFTTSLPRRRLMVHQPSSAVYGPGKGAMGLEGFRGIYSFL